MTDIVERLREAPWGSDLIDEAADEIERLRCRFNELEASYVTTIERDGERMMEMSLEIERLRGDNEKLKAAVAVVPGEILPEDLEWAEREIAAYEAAKREELKP